MGKHATRKARGEPPCPQQILRLMAGRPNVIDKMLGAVTGKPITKNVDLARILKTTVGQITKTKKALKETYDATGTTNIPKWKPKGRPLDFFDVNATCLEYVISHETLK